MKNWFIRNIKNVTIGLFLLFAFFGAIDEIVRFWGVMDYREKTFSRSGESNFSFITQHLVLGALGGVRNNGLNFLFAIIIFCLCWATIYFSRKTEQFKAGWFIYLLIFLKGCKILFYIIFYPFDSYYRLFG